MDPEHPVSEDSDDDIPILDASMLQSSIDFEAGMGWFFPVTYLLIVACLVVFGFEVSNNALLNFQRLVDMGALSDAEVARGEYWRLLSAAFLHADPEHLIGNMLILLILGLACEHAFGSSQALFLYLACAIGGSCASLVSAKTSVGASGAIFGLAGALIGMFRRHRNVLHMRDRRIGFVISIWAIYSIAGGFLNPRIDNLAHLGGFGTGMVLGVLLPLAIMGDRNEFACRPLTIASLLVSLLLLASMSAWFIPRLLG